MPEQGRPVLELEGVSKRFGAVRALEDVDLTLFGGEVMGIVGDNGAGKSTLVNVVSGNVRPDGGQISVNGVPRSLASPGDARAAGIETVFQTLCLIDSLSIADNVFLTRELEGATGLRRATRAMAKGSMRRRAVEGFERLGLTLPVVTTKVGALSGGQRQAVAIARAVLWGSHIVVMDEPTAALGVRQTEMVLGFIEQLKHHAVSVIVISHNMEHIMRVSDRVVVLRLGRKVFDVPAAVTDGHELVTMMTGAVAQRARTAENGGSHGH